MNGEAVTLTSEKWNLSALLGLLCSQLAHGHVGQISGQLRKLVEGVEYIKRFDVFLFINFILEC